MNKPKQKNKDDVKIEERYKDKVEIIPVQNFHEVLRAALPKEFHYVADKYQELATESASTNNSEKKIKKSK